MATNYRFIILIVLSAISGCAVNRAGVVLSPESVRFSVNLGKNERQAEFALAIQGARD